MDTDGRAGSPLPAGRSIATQRRARSDAPYRENRFFICVHLC